jgi:pyrophosphatase PpaX
MRDQLQRYNLHLSDQQIVQKLFGRYEEGIRELPIPSGDLAGLGKEIIAFGRQQMPLVDLYPGALELLRVLVRKKRKIGLITASYRDVIQIAIARHELLDVFGIVVTGDEVKAQKPDPDGILTALRFFGAKPERAVMIGDSKKDLLAGRNAGIDTVLFYPPEHATQHDMSELMACIPAHTIHSWQEFLDGLQ